MPDIMHWRITSSNLERLVAGLRQSCSFGEKWIEDDGLATIGFAPHSEKRREPRAQPVPCLRVGRNSQADRGGGTRMHGPPDALAEPLLQHPVHQWQFAAAAGYVQRFEIARFHQQVF